MGWTIDQAEEPGKGEPKGKGKGKGKGRGRWKAQQDQGAWEEENEAGWGDDVEDVIEADTWAEKKWKPVAKDKDKEQANPAATDHVDDGSKKNYKKKGTPTWKPK